MGMLRRAEGQADRRATGMDGQNSVRNGWMMGGRVSKVRKGDYLKPYGIYKNRMP